ncbi:TonB-dependent receptor [Corticibacter populi]|uniref:TonB-dependent receptor n=1 Tax=Corticibacter populi TaxID=1550736 RepID=A0A3M6QQM9_9BURK|nr:TonB-dependent receptor [Corticibacter populi]RMX04859.1 TonB-dependent receptor [Corticibacter populi]RZS33719.1 outer membrane receptor for ferrienterochelin and colicins [Corticibacter populi]
MPRKPFALNQTPIALSAALLCAASTAVAQTSAPEEAKALSEVVVSASGFEQEIKKAPASITVVTREQLENNRTTTLAEALSEVEGVDVGTSVDKMGNPNISIRGMGQDYTLILVDGKRQGAAGALGPNGFEGYSAAFLPPVAAIERIEVIRGPMSTLYGSDAMGGVINIITRKVSDRLTGSVSVDATIQENSDRGNLYGGNLYLSAPIQQDLLGIQVRASTKHREESLLEATGDAGSSTISTRGPSPVKADIHTLGTRLTLTPNKQNEIYLDADIARQSYDNSEGQLGTIGVRGYEEKLKFERNQIVLAHNGNFSFGRLESALTHNKTQNIGRTLPNDTSTARAGDPRTIEGENTILDTKLITTLGEANLLSVGAQYWRAKMIDGAADSDPFKHTQWALFGEDEWSLTESLAVTLGARYDHHSAFGSHISPRVYAVWETTPNLTLKGGVSGGFKTPNLNDLVDGINGWSGQGTIPLIGTPGLKPEKSTNFEFGAQFDDLQGFNIGGTVFLNKFKDKITSGNSVENCSWNGQPNRPGCVDYGNFPSVDTYSQKANVDKAETKGVELNSRIPVSQDLYATANYTFTRSKNKTTGAQLVNTPKHMFNAKLHWKINNQFSSWAGLTYRGERLRSDTVARAQLGDLKAATVLNIGGSYQINKAFRINAAIYNLLDKDFLEYGSYTNSNGNTAYTSLYNTHEEGRRLWISATYDF